MAEITKYVLEDTKELAKEIAEIIKAELRSELFQDNTVFTMEEAADYLHCCLATVQRHTKSGEIPSSLVGTRRFIYKRKLDEWLEKGGSQ